MTIKDIKKIEFSITCKGKGIDTKDTIDDVADYCDKYQNTGIEVFQIVKLKNGATLSTQIKRADEPLYYSIS